MCDQLRKVASILESYDQSFVGKPTSVSVLEAYDRDNGGNIDASISYVRGVFDQIALTVNFTQVAGKPNVMRMITMAMMTDDDNRSQLAMLVAVHIRHKMKNAGIEFEVWK